MRYDTFEFGIMRADVHADNPICVELEMPDGTKHCLRPEAMSILEFNGEVRITLHTNVNKGVKQ